MGASWAVLGRRKAEKEQKPTPFNNLRNITDFRLLLGRPGGPLGGHLAAILGCLGAILGVLEAILGVLEASWAVFGLSWGRLGGLLGRHGAILEASWAILGRS